MGVGGQHHVYYAENTALIYADRPSTACPNKFWILIFFVQHLVNLKGHLRCLARMQTLMNFFIFRDILRLFVGKVLFQTCWDTWYVAKSTQPAHRASNGPLLLYCC